MEKENYKPETSVHDSHEEIPSELLKEESYSDSCETSENGEEIAKGFVLLIIGIIVTVGSYSMAGNGGMYLIAIGPIICGVIRIFKGLCS